METETITELAERWGIPRHRIYRAITRNWIAADKDSSGKFQIPQVPPPVQVIDRPSHLAVELLQLEGLKLITRTVYRFATTAAADQFEVMVKSQ